MSRRLLWWVLFGAAAIAAVAFAVVYFGGEEPEEPPSAPPELVVAETPAAPPEREGLVILQIGDSHTAADFFTGRARDVLQERYGEGGILLPPGTPQAGVRNSVFAIEASPGWVYDRVRQSSHPSRFWLTGYTAEASATGETITFSANHAVAFTGIDLSFITLAGGGAVDVLLDGEYIDTFDLSGGEEAPLIKRLIPVAGIASFETLTLRTASADPVIVTGVTVLQDASGVSFLSVGFPGATADIILDIDATNLANDLARIDPDVIVLAFGTNEGFNDNLNIDRYQAEFSQILEFLAVNSSAREIVVVIPPYASRSGQCTGANCGPAGYACWNIPPALPAVREAQTAAAEAIGARVWDWAAALPAPCGREAGATDVYGPDRIHLTNTGYRMSGERFAEYLATLLPAQP